MVGGCCSARVRLCVRHGSEAAVGIVAEERPGYGSAREAERVGIRGAGHPQLSRDELMQPEEFRAHHFT